MTFFNLGRQWLRAGAFFLAVFALVAPAGAQNAGNKESKKKFTEPAENIFTNNQIFRLQIEIPEKGLETLRGYQFRGWGGGAQDERPSVKCTVREGDKVYTDVAVHLKGAAGSFRPVDANPGLTLNFAKHVKGQTFHGWQRISLNNSVQDPSLLSEQICRELFAAAGVPVPRATHATVELNGRKLGVYVLVEAYNKQFLAHHFKDATGNLYDGGFLKDVDGPLTKSSGKNPEDRSDLKRLADAAREKDPTKRMVQLDKVLDLDRFISLLAMDTITCNTDGYGINKNNYRLYHDPTSDKFVFMPHGLDQMFGTFRTGTDMPIYPRMSGLVADAVLAAPAGRERYKARLTELMTNVFKVEVITNRVWELAAKIKPALAEKSRGSANFHSETVKAFCHRIVERTESVREQLTAPDTTLQFDPAGFARLADWKARVDYGKPLVDEVTDKSGKKLLHINAAGGSAVGAWTTKVKLEPGRYRLEGRMKCQGVTPEPGDRKAGAGLRIAGRRFDQKLSGDSDWTLVACEFETQNSRGDFGPMARIESSTPEVELICEMRAKTGEIWIDRESLRLLRK
ncbi:MAG: CotH kinase family protein [Verrucomicrobia bacterium]|nr:CotH kinase family protein [Verrucomicrobiota bacterium]